MDTLAATSNRLSAFVEARQWGQVHDPKNLAMALAAEAGELLALFQWLSPDESAAVATNVALRRRVQDEMADVLIYLVCFANSVGIDPIEAARIKLDENEVRFPAAAKGPTPVPEK